MQFIPSMELNRRTMAGKNQAPAALAETDRLIDLASWMMVLATIRLVCTIADYASAFLDATRSNGTVLQVLGKFVQESHPLFAVGILWPLVLAIALRTTRWPELLKAAAATFLILSICGILEFAAVWAHTRSTLLTLGSFHVPRRALTSPYFSELVLSILGATQIVLEFAIAVWSILLGGQLRRSAATEPDKQLAARRARFGRLALFVSVAFFVLVVRASVWSAYLEVLNQSSFVREFVLKNDFERIHPRRVRPRTAEEIERDRQATEMQVLFGAASRAWEDGHIASARDSYLKLVSLVDAVPADRWTGVLRYTASNVFNNLAWLLATSSKVELRNPEGAVVYAKRAVSVSPTDGNSWNTLGVAYFRAGELEEAKNALYRSMELRNEGDSFDWFFLALIHFKLGHKDRALEWYDRAAKGLQRVHQLGGSLTLVQMDELYRFELEAAELMGLPKPAPSPSRLKGAIQWTGAEVIGVPVPAVAPTTAHLSRARTSPLSNSPYRLERRMPRSLPTPAPPGPQGR